MRELAKKMAEEVGIEGYDVLFSTREFKKTSMQYFDNWPADEEASRVSLIYLSAQRR